MVEKYDRPAPRVLTPAVRYQFDLFQREQIALEA